ncbi:MAG: Mut7-C RNAse domain-containing protein [Nitriliruptoraceae bacterium]
MRMLAGMRTTVHLEGDLVDLVGEPEHDIAVVEPRSVKDLVESIGIPHPEIGLLVVDQRSVGFDQRVFGGEQVTVHPPGHEVSIDPRLDLWPEPVEPRRFVLDVHLGTLARRLRVLGYDSWYRSEASDPELAGVAVGEDRILISRDRQLLMRRTILHGYCPRSDDPDQQLDEVVHRYQLTGAPGPLTRCPRCNGLLASVTREEVGDQLPPRTRMAFTRFARCARCGQIYWPGAHRAALERVITRARGRPPAGSSRR